MDKPYDTTPYQPRPYEQDSRMPRSDYPLHPGYVAMRHGGQQQGRVAMAPVPQRRCVEHAPDFNARGSPPGPCQEGPDYSSRYHPQQRDLPPSYHESTAPRDLHTMSPSPALIIPRPSSSSSAPSLSRLIAIPATEPSLGSPFLRAYPPALAAFDIPRDVFLPFLDRVNRAAVASPPVQVLGLAGSVVSMVPLHTAQAVGGAVNAAARIGAVAVSRGRVEMLLREANRDVFGPRGLRVGVAKLGAVAALAGMPIVGPDGKIDRRSPVLAPFDDDGGDDDHAAHSLSAQQRRLRALAPWTAPLDVEDLPAAAPPSNPLSRMHASASERQRASGERKLLKGRRKAHAEWARERQKAQADHDRRMRELDRDEDKARRKGSDRDLRRVEERRARAERELARGTDKADRERARGDGEEKGVRRICFLVVTNADGRVG